MGKGDATTVMAGGKVVPPWAAKRRRVPFVTVKDLLWAIYLYPLRWLVAGSPRATRGLAQVATPMFRLLSTRRAAEVRARLTNELGVGLTDAESDVLARRYIANAVRRALDDLDLANDREEPICRAFRGREFLDEALAGRRGVLLVSFHWYAERAAKRYLAKAGYPVLSVRSQDPHDPRASRLGKRLLQPRYIRFLHEVLRDEVFAEDPECSLKILRRLRSGGITDIHIDAQYTRDLARVPFLGRDRSFPTGPLRLARVAGCPVLPMAATGHLRSLEIRIDPPLPLDYTLSSEELCRESMPVLLRAIEGHVREYPDQWELWTRL